MIDHWSDVTFNIPFVPGTVRHLQPFTLSLLLHSRDCRFRLVSNGCRPDENDRLMQLAKSSDRFEFLRLPWDRVQPHGRALHVLHEGERSRVFAFMDSDIFATGAFQDDFRDVLGECAAVFSCPPVWSNQQVEQLPEGFRVISGVCNRLHDGFCVGGSYFAVYDNRVLTDCLRETGITLERYYWDDVPSAVQEELQSQHHDRLVYDTTKLVNILLGHRGFACRFVASPALVHVGGISAVALGRHPSLSRFVQRVPRLKQLARRIIWAIRGRPNWRNKVTHCEREYQIAKDERRRWVCGYLWAMIRALADGGTYEAVFEHPDSELTSSVRRAEQEIRGLFSGGALETVRVSRRRAA